MGMLPIGVKGAAFLSGCVGRPLTADLIRSEATATRFKSIVSGRKHTVKLSKCFILHNNHYGDFLIDHTTAFQQRVICKGKKTPIQTALLASPRHTALNQVCRISKDLFSLSLGSSSRVTRSLAAQAFCLQHGGHCGHSEGQSPRLPG